MPYANRGACSNLVDAGSSHTLNDRPVGTEPRGAPISSPLDGLKSSGRRRLGADLFCPHRLQIFRLEVRVQRLTRVNEILKAVNARLGQIAPVLLLIPSMLLGVL